jgi:hypothetical protein
VLHREVGRVKLAEVGRFWFDESCSPEEIGALTPILAKHERILPPWIDKVHVECRINGRDTENCIAEVTTRAEYRRIGLTVYSLWLNETPEHREHAIVHELMHAYTNGQRIFSQDAVRLATEGSENKADLKHYLFEQERKINEAATEDLTLLLRRLGYFDA